MLRRIHLVYGISDLLHYLNTSMRDESHDSRLIIHQSEEPMTLGPPNTPRIRVLDLETTGLSPDDHVVEIAALDLIGHEIVPIGSHLVRPPIPIPPQAYAIHHITGDDVRPCRTLDEYLPFYLDQTGTRACSRLNRL